MRCLLALLLLLIAAATPAAAQQVRVRQWTDAQGVVWTETTTVEVVGAEEMAPGRRGSDRFVAAEAPATIPGLARFGPFVVLDRTRAALVAQTDGASPAAFARMMAAYPGIAVLTMIDCPGTVDDTANLALGRMIRARGLATEVPPGGSVRSGAVELFLAGARRHAAPDAEFAVHAWEDEQGRSPRDFAPEAGPNRLYLDYYRAMGLPPEKAGAFYALTNSVPNSRVLWLTTADIARYAAVE